MGIRTEAEFRDYVREGFKDNPHLIDGFLDWYESRPPSVRRLMREFGIGDKVEMDGKTWHIIGYTEGDQIVISTISPAEDRYDEMMERREYICADHLREAPAVDLNPRSARHS